MTWKEKYEILVKEIAEKPIKDFNIFEPAERPDVFDKIVYVGTDKGVDESVFNGKLPEDSSEEDYKLYCEFLTDYVGYELSYFFADEKGE